MAAPKGNKFAAKAKECEQALKRALARKADGDWRKGLDEIADGLVALAVAKERWAVEELFSRIDGRPAQAIEHSGEVTHRTARELPTDEQLADIATGSGAGVDGAAEGPSEPPSVH
jgi:hypothetical protein